MGSTIDWLSRGGSWLGLLLSVPLYVCQFVLLALIDVFELLFGRQKSVRGQIVLVTGSAQGIGRSVARRFALEHGAVVVLVDLNEEKLIETAEQIEHDGGVCHRYVCDVSNPEQLEELASRIYGDLETDCVDVLVCNAGVLHLGLIHELSCSQIRSTMDVDLLGCFWTVRAFLGGMQRAKRGHIVSVSSVAGHFGETTATAYSAAKFGIRGLMESLEYEMLDTGTNVRCTTVYPYFTDTTLVTKWNPTSNWFPLLTPEVCSYWIVKGILLEKVEYFCPSYMVFFCTFVKSIVTYRVKLISRKFFGVKFHGYE